MVKGCLCIHFACLLRIRKRYLRLRLCNTHGATIYCIYTFSLIQYDKAWEKLKYFTAENYMNRQDEKCAMKYCFYNLQMSTFLQCNILKAHSCKYKMVNDNGNDIVNMARCTYSLISGIMNQSQESVSTSELIIGLCYRFDCAHAVDKCMN